MKTIIHTASKNIPDISYDDAVAMFLVQGISTPINAFEFYQSVVQWIDTNENEISEKSVFKFNLPYFNSATMKALLILLERIKKGINSGKNWTIVWVIEDDDEFMEDAAESFQNILGINFDITAD